jgi:hypothetical protein
MRSLLSLLTGLLVTVLLLSFSSSSLAESGPKFGKITDAEWQLSFPADYPEANAVVIFDRCSLMVAPDLIEIERHVRMKILRTAGATEIGDVNVYYQEGDRIKDLKAQTINPNGTVTKVAGKDIFEKVVGEWKVKTFSFPATDSGCIVEYTYRNLNERFGYLEPWDFQSDIYTCVSRLALTLYPGFTYSSSHSNVPVAERDPVVTEVLAPGDFYTKLKSFAWERTNILPVIDEPYMGAERDYYSSMHYQLVSYKSPTTGMIYSFIKDWKDLGVEFDKFLQDYTSGAKLKPILEQLHVETMTPLEKTKALYKYVTANFAVKDEPGGGWFNHDKLGEMVKEASGAANEKNVLLIELLKAAGVKSWPVLISTRDQRRFNPEVFHLRQFNRIICYTQIDDSSGIYMDATTKYCPFGMLPPNCLVEGGFLIDGKQSLLVRILTTEHRTYRLDVTHMFIDSLGAARCSSLCTFTGYAASNYGRWSEQQTLEDFVDDYFLDKVSENTSVVSQSFTVDSSGRFEISMVYTVPDYARALDNNLVVTPVSYRFRENPFEREKRFYPIDFDFPQTYHNMVVIHSDRPISSATLPQTVTSSAPGISFKRSAQFADGTVMLDAKLTITKALIEPELYPQVKKLYDDVAHASHDEVILQIEGMQ